MQPLKSKDKLCCRAPRSWCELRLKAAFRRLLFKYDRAAASKVNPPMDLWPCQPTETV